MASGRPTFNKSLSLSYLGLPDNYLPSPETETLNFLRKHINQLPPHLLLHFSYITSAKERTALPIIRNRRLKYTSLGPAEFQFHAAKGTWPNLWHGYERWGMKEAAEERAWVGSYFLEGSTKHVGNLGNLLGGYEEEREAERIRILRREQLNAADQFIPEEDDSSDEEQVSGSNVEDESLEEAKNAFERSIRERFIYGLLEPFEYDNVDWDESLDEEDEREAEDRWFDSE